MGAARLKECAGDILRARSKRRRGCTLRIEKCLRGENQIGNQTVWEAGWYRGERTVPL